MAMTQEEKQAAAMRQEEERRRKEQQEAEERQRLHMQQMEAQQMRQQQANQGPAGMNGGVSPMMASQISGMGGGSAAAGGGSAAGGSAAGSGAAGGSAAGGGSALAAAGPWAALAAAVLVNENYHNKDGRRPDSKAAWLRESLTGESSAKDTQYWGDKIGGPVGDNIKSGGKIMERVVRPDKTLTNSKILKPWEWF